MSVFYLENSPEEIERRRVAQEEADRYTMLMAGMSSAYLRNDHDKKFPRSDADKVRRMNRFVEWKRTQQRRRMLIHLAVGGALAFGTPVAIAVGSWLWRWAISAVAG